MTAKRQFTSTVLLLLMLSTANLSTATPQRVFTVKDDIALSVFGDPYTGEVAPITFSPDGQYFAVVTMRGRLDLNRSESALRIFRMSEVRQFLLHPKSAHPPAPVWFITKATYKEGPIITHIRWAADSSGVAFLAKTATGIDQLFLADIPSKSVLPLTPEGQQVTGFDVRSRNQFVYAVQSPLIRKKFVEESQTTAFVGTGRPLDGLIFSENAISNSLWMYDLSDLWANLDGKRFRVVQRSSGGAIRLHMEGLQALALSPDGRSVVTATTVPTIPKEWETLYPPPFASSPYHIRAGTQDPEGFAGQRDVSEYVLINLSKGQIRNLTHAPISNAAGWWGMTHAGWSANGQSIVLSNTFLPPDTQNLQQSLNSPCIAIVDVTKGSVNCVDHLKGEKEDGNEEFDYITDVKFASGSNRHIVASFSSYAGLTATNYTRLDDGSWKKDLRTKGSSLGGGSIEVKVKEDFSSPPVLVGTDNAGKSYHVIWDPNPQLKDLSLSAATIFRWKDKTGRDWVGGLYKPPDYVQGRRYPLVIQNHGFAENQFRPSGVFPTSFAAQELAAAGFAVLQVRDCSIRTTPDEGSCNVRGYEAAVEQLAQDGVIDPDRVGIIGFSRTCYYVMEALTTSTLGFKAASITDGVMEGYLQYITSVDDDGDAMAHEADAMIGAPPFKEGLQQWFRRSPEFNMDKVEAPLQVVALGRLSLLFMWEPYAALRYLKKPVDLVVLNSDEHVLTDPAARMVSQGGTVDWFRFWLQGYEDLDPAKAEQYKRWRGLRKLQEENKKNSEATAESH